MTSRLFYRRWWR